MKTSRKTELIAFKDKELDRYTKDEETAISFLEWSETSLGLSKLVNEFILPQIVRIEDGYYSQEEDSSLSSGQILKIHCVKTVNKLAGIDQHGSEVHVPLNTSTRVRLRPENFRDVYETANDLSRVRPLPKFVEVTRGYFNPVGLDGGNIEDLTVDPGEVLEVVRPADHQLFLKPNQERYMIFKNSRGEEFKLPYQCSPGFRVLLERDNCLLAEALSCHKLPIFASFVEKAQHRVEPFDRAGKLEKFGVIEFHSLYEEKLVVASCGHESTRVVFTIPKDIDVTFKVAKGALTNDPEYTGLCHGYNNYKHIEELTIKRHERDIYRKSGEVRGYEYCLRSASQGEFLDMEGEDEELENNDTDHEDVYVYNDQHNVPIAKSTSRRLVTPDNKKVLTLPYEVTDIHVSDFKKGGKYFVHLSQNEDTKGFYDFQECNSTDGDQSVQLVKYASFGTAEQEKCEGKAVETSKSEHKKGICPEESSKEEGTTGGPIGGTLKASAETLTVQSTAEPNSSRQPTLGTPNVTATSTFPLPSGNSEYLSPVFTDQINAPDKEEKSNAAISENRQKEPFQIPSDLSQLSSMEVCSCLHALNLGHLKEVFLENQINGDLLISLEDGDYKDLKLTNFERKKMMRFVEGWRPDTPNSRG